MYIFVYIYIHICVYKELRFFKPHLDLPAMPPKCATGGFGIDTLKSFVCRSRTPSIQDFRFLVPKVAIP